MPPSIRVDSWEDWTRIYNDVSVWQGLIDAICSREGISYRQLHPASDNTNAVFLLDRAFAVKIYSPFWNEYEFERTLLEALKSHDEIPTPELVTCGHISDADGTSWPYLITRYCPARSYSEIRQELTHDNAMALARQLGQIVRALHALDTSQLASAATERTWNDVVFERRSAAVGELVAAGVLNPGIQDSLDMLLDEVIADAPSGERVVAHGDLGPDHVLCARTEGGWRIEALIDFGDAKIGVREYEWMPVWMGFCRRNPVLARGFLDGYDPGLLHDAAFPSRAVAWTLLHDFGTDELIRCCRGLGQLAPVETMEELRSLLCPVSILR